MAVISINLGLLNFLPVPILDGGLLVFFTLELFKRRPPSPRAREIATYVGLVIVATLMLFALRNDVVRYLLPTIDMDGSRNDAWRRSSLASTPRRRRRGWRCSTARAACASPPRRPPSATRSTCCRCATRRCARSGVAPAALGGHRLRRRPGQLHRPARRPGGRQGAGAADGRPLLLVSSLARAGAGHPATATPCPGAAAPTAVPCIDAGKGQIYAGLFRSDSAQPGGADR